MCVSVRPPDNDEDGGEVKKRRSGGAHIEGSRGRGLFQTLTVHDDDHVAEVPIPVDPLSAAPCR